MPSFEEKLAALRSGSSFGDRLNAIRTKPVSKLPPGYSDEDMPKPGESRFKSFAREAGIATTPREGARNLGRMGTSALKAGAGIVGGTLKAGLGLMAPPTNVGRQIFPDYVNPAEQVVRDAAGSHVDVAKRGMAELKRGEFSRGAGHLTASVLPVIGPAAASVADKLGTPETPEAIGEGVAYLAAPKIIKETGKVAGRGVKAGLDAPGGVRTFATETVPTHIANAMIGATRKYFRFGANPGEAVRNIVVNTLDELPAKLDSQIIGPVSQQLDSVLASPKAQAQPPIDLYTMFKKGFQSEIDRATRNGDAALLKALEARREARWQQAMQESGGKVLVDPATANRIKQSIGNDTVWTSDPLGKSINDAMQDSYSAIKREVNDRVPEARVLNHKLANAITAKKAIDAALMSEQAAHPLISKLKGFGRVGAVTALATGHPLVAATAMLPEVLGSPRVQSRVAAGLSKLQRK